MIKYLVFVLLLSPLFAKSQKNLTPEDEKYIKSQAQKYIKTVLKKIEDLGSTGKGLSDKERKIIIETTLSYFEETALVQVMNLNKRKNTYSVDYYLRKIVSDYTKRFDYVTVHIETNNFNVSDLIPVMDQTGKIISYKCYYKFVQGFCAKIDNENREKPLSKNPEDFDVCERTWKTGEIIIKRAFSPSKGDRWVISLGDIKANQIKSLKSSG